MKFALTVLLAALTAAGTVSAATGDTRIANWKNDCKGALSFGYDDSYDSHALIAVPEMAKRGLVGSFFCNPDRSSYITYQKIWEEWVPANGQELCNHSMNHTNVADYAQAEYEIGDCSKRIWSVYPSVRSRLVAWAKPGGTTWNITSAQETELLNKYHCISRGSAPRNRSIVYDNGYDAAKMIVEAQWAITNNTWVSFYTHSISESGIGYLSSKEAEILAFYDWMAASKDSLWNGGFIQIHQYKNERDNSTVSTGAVSSSSITLNVTTTLDTALYKFPLTLVTDVPSDWDLCRIVCDGTTSYARAAGGKLMFDAPPGRGSTVITSMQVPVITGTSGPTAVYEGQKVTFHAATITDGAVTWQWQKNGTDIPGADDSIYVISNAATGDAGTYRCVASEGGNSVTGTGMALAVNAPQVMSGLTFGAEHAYLEGDFIVKSESYLYHEPAFPALQPEDGGKASLFFQVPQAGDYQVQALIMAYREGYRTVFINIDDEPVDSTMAWDIEITSGFEWRTASWRGNGTVDANQYAPKTFSLDAGVHELVIRGGDQKIRIDTVSIVGTSGIDPILPLPEFTAGTRVIFDAAGQQIYGSELPKGVYFEYDPARNELVKRINIR